MVLQDNFSGRLLCCCPRRRKWPHESNMCLYCCAVSKSLRYKKVGPFHGRVARPSAHNINWWYQSRIYARAIFGDLYGLDKVPEAPAIVRAHPRQTLTSPSRSLRSSAHRSAICSGETPGWSLPSTRRHSAIPARIFVLLPDAPDAMHAVSVHSGYKRSGFV